MENQQNEPQMQERLPWHKPEVERLVVTLDTQFVSGTITDGFNGSAEG